MQIYYSLGHPRQFRGVDAIELSQLSPHHHLQHLQDEPDNRKIKRLQDYNALEEGKRLTSIIIVNSIETSTTKKDQGIKEKLEECQHCN